MACMTVQHARGCRPSSNTHLIRLRVLSQARCRTRRSIGGCCRAERSEAPELPRFGRRRILSASLLVPLVWHTSREALAETLALTVETTADGLLVDGDDFELLVPNGFKNLGIPEVKRPAGGFVGGVVGAPPPPSPIKARFSSEDGSKLVTVIVRDASGIKPTFFQLQDVSQWGSGTDVAQILLPPGVRVQSFDSTSVPQPPKDTGTVRGVVEQPPRNYYRYSFLAPDGQRLVLAAAAQKGRVYTVIGSAGAGEWDAETRQMLDATMRSFRVKEPFRPPS